jgi:hypothetical protein
MLHFSPVTIGDKEAIQAFFDKSVFRNCDFSFSNIFCWKHLYNTTFFVEDGCLYIRFQTHDDMPRYLFPLGEGNLKHAIERMVQDSEGRGDEFCLYAATQEMFDLIEQSMPGQFNFTKVRDWYEYLYLSKELISLTGKKHQAKRNHVHKFTRTYQWEYLPITRDIIPDCLELYERWSKGNGYSEQSLIDERIATQKAFRHYEELGLIGGALRINGEIVAYSYGQALAKNTFGIHAEKCLYEIDGGFSMINQQFAEHNCADFLYINREEDLGIASLRQAKMSYHPALLLEKGVICKKYP